MLTVQGPTVNQRANTTLTLPSTKTHHAGTVDIRCGAKPTSSLSSSTEGTRQSYVCSASDAGAQYAWTGHTHRNPLVRVCRTNSGDDH